MAGMNPTQNLNGRYESNHRLESNAKLESNAIELESNLNLLDKLILHALRLGPKRRIHPKPETRNPKPETRNVTAISRYRV